MFVLSFTTSHSSAGDSSTLAWNGFNDGLKRAKKEGKKILVDVYTDWCGWCKKMDRDVYANSKIVDYLGNRYIVIKLNAESKDTITYREKKLTKIELTQAFGITGYPATIFMKPDGEPITKIPGYMAADKFIDVITFIGEDYYLSQKWEDYSTRKKK